MSGLFDITEDEYKEIDKRLAARYRLTENSSPQVVLQSLRHASANYREIAPEIRVAPEKLIAFISKWMAKVL